MTLGSDAANDIYYRNSSGVLTRLANGTTGQVLKATTSNPPSWGPVTASGLLFQSSTPATVDVTNNSKHTLITNSIAGGTLGTANVIRWTMKGSWAQGAAGRTLTFRMEYGSTIVWTGAIQDSNTATGIFEMECILYATGATNSQTGTGRFSGTTISAQWADIVIFAAINGTNANATENSTGALNLLLTTQFDNISNAPTVSIDSYTIEILR